MPQGKLGSRRATAVLVVAATIATSCGSTRVRTAPPVESSVVPTSAAVSTTAPAQATTTTTTSATTTTTTTITSTSSTSTSASSPPRCPAARLDLSQAPKTDAEMKAREADQNMLGADMEVVRTYGMAHPDEWMGDLFTLDAPARVLVRFSAHVADHQAALAKLVAHPDRLDVVASAHSPADVQRVAQELATEVKAHLAGIESFSQSWGPGDSSVFIGLGPGQEERAAAFVARWGELIAIDLAGRPYVPKGCGTPPPPIPCPDLTSAKDAASSGLNVAIVGAPASMARSATGQAKVEITNTGSAHFSMDTGQPIVGVIVASGTATVVGVNSGGIAGTGYLVDLAPGDQKTLDMVFGAASCGDPATTAIAPGTYGLRVVLTREGAKPGDPAYLSPEVPITITA